MLTQMNILMKSVSNAIKQVIATSRGASLKSVMPILLAKLRPYLPVFTNNPANMHPDFRTGHILLGEFDIPYKTLPETEATFGSDHGDSVFSSGIINIGLYGRTMAVKYKYMVSADGTLILLASSDVHVWVGVPCTCPSPPPSITY